MANTYTNIKKQFSTVSDYLEKKYTNKKDQVKSENKPSNNDNSKVIVEKK